MTLDEEDATAEQQNGVHVEASPIEGVPTAEDQSEGTREQVKKED